MPLLDSATLFLDPAELDEVLASLESETLNATAAQLRSQLMTPQSLVTKDLLRLDPIGFLPRLLVQVRLGGFGVSVDPETGCLIDDGRRFMLMMAKPVRPAQDLEFDRELTAGLDRRVEESRGRLAGGLLGPTRPGWSSQAATWSPSTTPG